MVEYRGPIAVDLGEIDDAMRPASEMRVGLDREAVKEYAHILGEMPPVKLMWDEKEQRHWVVDGAHTLTAHAGAGQKTVQATVAEGNYLAAWQAAARENQRRGVRITPADRRERVKRACRNLPGLVKDWPWSVNRLAKFCGVDAKVTGEALDEALDQAGIDPDTPRTTASGWARAARNSPPTGRATAENSEISNLAPAPRNGHPVSPPPPAPPPSPYKGLRRILDEIMTMMSSVNARYDPAKGGWGGFAAVWERLSPSERTEVSNDLADVMEGLGEWTRIAGGQHEG